MQRVICYIVAGDIYIANLTHSFSVKSPRMPEDVFWELRPSPLGGYLNYGDFQIISSSMEQFIKIQGSRIEPHPIKGTRRRGKTQEEDQMLRQALLDSAKDHSELLMIADLERNNLNRICQPGSWKTLCFLIIKGPVQCLC